MLKWKSSNSNKIILGFYTTVYITSSAVRSEIRKHDELLPQSKYAQAVVPANAPQRNFVPLKSVLTLFVLLPTLSNVPPLGGSIPALV